MRVHVTNWTVNKAEDGETIVNANPPGRLMSATIQTGIHTDWLRLVTIEDEEIDPVLNELVNVRTEIADLREQLRTTFDYPLPVVVRPHT